ncbi:hypothetical protein ES705_33318 [subsurface metagenome]
MSKHKVRGKGLGAKRAELHEINKGIIEVEKSMEELRGYHKELVNQRFGIKTEIRFLGGKVPAGKEDAGTGLGCALTRGRKLSDERP